MGTIGVHVNNKQTKEVANVELVTPHGTSITVTPSRAKSLLARPSIRMGDGVARVYAHAGEDNVEVAPVTGAKPPRKGDRNNSPESE